MSAVTAPRRVRSGRRTRTTTPGGQAALFGAGSMPAVPAAPAVPVEPVEAPAAAVASPAAEPTHAASAHRHGPSLDDLVAGAWEGLLAGAPADCLVCGALMSPRHSAGAGIVGGRCDGCSTTVC